MKEMASLSPQSITYLLYCLEDRNADGSIPEHSISALYELKKRISKGGDIEAAYCLQRYREKLRAEQLIKAAYAHAQDNDREAVKILHKRLAAAVKHNLLLPYSRKLLSELHESIYKGHDASVAMLTNNPSHAPAKVMRNKAIYTSVMLAQIFSNSGKSRIDIYKSVARSHGLKWRTVKGIYLAEKKKQTARSFTQRVDGSVKEIHHLKKEQ